MKEATKNPNMTITTGLLSSTVLTIIAIGTIAIFFNLFVWPSLKTNILNSTKCSSATNCLCTGKKCKCSYFSGNTLQEITCPNNNVKK